MTIIARDGRTPPTGRRPAPATRDRDATIEVALCFLALELAVHHPALARRIEKEFGYRVRQRRASGDRSVADAYNAAAAALRREREGMHRKQAVAMQAARQETR